MNRPLAIPEAVTGKLTSAAIFLVLTVKPDPAASDAARTVVGNIDALVRSVGFGQPDGGVTCVVGFGSDVWERLFGLPRPAELHPFREIRTGTRHAIATPGDMLLHIRAERHDLCFELAALIMNSLGDAVAVADEVQGFQYLDRRDLLGFVDGTENPVDQEAIEAALVGDDDPGFAGGSYVIVQKYLHDMAGWNGLSTEAQERIIGRTKLQNVELDDAVKPTSAHNALTTIVENGKEMKILRDNMPFGRPGRGEFGTYFIGYCHTPRTIERMLENMFIGRPPGNYDRILDFSRAVTGSLFFAPSATFLERVAAGEIPAGDADAEPLVPEFALGWRWIAWDRQSQRKGSMNNLHRELAPISDAAWAQIEDETTRTLKRYLAGRRVVDLGAPEEIALSAVGTGHLHGIAAPGDGIIARQRDVKALVELRVPFELDRQQVDDVERGANDSDWQPAKDAARKIAFAEDAAIFDGYAGGGITGIRQGTSNPVMTLPGDVRNYPDAIAQALSQLRLVGVNGPYSVVLGAAAYTALAEASDNGYPVLQHVRRLVETDIVWAPAIEGAVVLTTRGGDFDLHVGQDVSIGYLSHTETSVRLYLQESFTFLLLTTEALVALAPAGKAPGG